ncbi:hypothetical protein DDT52_06775 [Brenneria roseae subsp. roseae]|nr:hypothetical protein DDT52_06775 [Brenneria roseae subsp. roseae]
MMFFDSDAGFVTFLCKDKAMLQRTLLTLIVKNSSHNYPDILPQPTPWITLIQIARLDPV